ncbi:PI4KA lipid kinase complex subunit hyccin [Cotesia typhae]|uniref:PI4KA lipid kinase complex subunit hyccin n=1 Tax=Cotesia typhae TaxID=2053667 RepID=UPI003D6874B3
MTESLINEWLADYADVSPAELPTFANTLSQDNEIVRALYVLLEERNKYSELIDPVCNQLFNFYRSREVQLQRFTLQFVPTLIFIYLNALAHGDIKNCRSVETLLIGLYNLEVVSETGDSKTVSFRLPSLAMLSIYHEPSSLTHASLTESAVRHFEECNSKLVRWGPLPQIETLNAQNRLKVMTALLFIYNQQLSYIQKSALEQLCKVATKLVTQGFPKPGHHQRASYNESSFVPRLLPRIPVTNQFLLEFLHGIYFAMYNDCWYVGCQAVDDIHNRVCYDGYADVMLVTNAIRNSSSSGPSGLLGDASLGISVALSPATTTPTISKSMITNASFRTKKLPDDIPIVAKEDGTADKNLVSISEEQDSTEPTRIGSLRQGKDKSSKITNFSLTKKPREKDSRAKNGMVEKEKKSGQIKDSKSRIDEEANGSVKKKNDSIISDGNSSFTEAGLNDTADLELESAVASMRVLDPDLNSSVQVSSV